ncbi:MAG TPA: 2-dehydropantoate 2-reductase [Candidatus Cybelea sp.]|nr:2-dehydropantoate 2-reductase [Candidatus Cybelea sp.]
MAAELLIWGAGAIGGTVGAYWRRAGHDVLFVDRDADHVAAINRDGLKITGPIAEFSVKAAALQPKDVTGSFETAFLCVKALDTASAIAALAPFVAANGCVVSLQNGLNENVIAAKIGAKRTIGAFINFGADYLSPGVVHYAGRGAVVIGELDGKKTPRIEALHRLMREFDERAILTTNIWGYLWGKLAYGAILFGTALTNDSIADCLAAPKYRPLFVALAREVEEVGVSSGVKLESFDGFDPAAFLPGASDAAAHASLDDQVTHNRKSAKTHTGIWRDLAVRKRRTEVDAQLGPIVETGKAQGIPTPITARLVELIHDIEDGRRPLAWETLDELAKVLPR